ncbi:uncharacterized protein LY89DRAFT_730676 [Mollisia scopiformis]|uniref:Uncharacterized protein n=1 Tax=Mollisia scopiformis TaxID=149040 RepID=A0A194XKG6_MOLSC|nr:uncharacterized protein LY89DRAFT_730676 [Mollisia scopiformis]KUJ20653.1 hypothetical protein LY89DRAFT_730676 [Mollisia scopiformis]
MCRITIRTFTECQHSINIYEHCASDPLRNHPGAIKGVCKTVAYKSVPNIFEHLRVTFPPGYKKIMNLIAKLETCPNWPSKIKNYETIEVDGTCLAEGGVCSGTRYRLIGYDKNGVVVDRPGP